MDVIFLDQHYSGINNALLSKRVRVFLKTIFSGLIGFLTISFGIIVIDSLYFKTMIIQLDESDSMFGRIQLSVRNAIKHI